jgi:hypothetical protein
MKLILLVIITVILVACNPAKVDNTSDVCPTVYEPVCGNDNVTYSNSCEAEKVGIMSYTLGACFVENETITLIPECDTIFNPVCGNNGVTYSNSCEAEKEGIIEYSLGRCVVLEKEQLIEVCSSIYEPVCGQNSQGLLTYTNLCLLNSDNSTFMYLGECKSGNNDIIYYENVDYSVDVDYYQGFWQYEVYIEKPTACHMVDVSRYYSGELSPKVGVVHFRIIEPANIDCGSFTRIEQFRGFFESDIDTKINMYLEGNLIYDNS